MLEEFPGFETRDPEINREIVCAEFDVRRFDGKFDERAFVARAHWADTKYLRVTSAYSSTTTDIIYDAAPVVRLFVHASAESQVEIGLGGSTFRLSDERPTVVIPAGSRFRGLGRNAHEVVALRVYTGGLKAVASALFDEDIPISDIEDERWTGTRVAGGLQQTAMQLIADLESGLPKGSNALDLFGQAFLARLLLTSSEGLGGKFGRHVPSPSLTQLRRVEEFIAANWQEDIDVEVIAAEFGISVRSIFRHFKTLRGVTPKVFAKELRLNHARELLRGADGNDGVMAIALRCGFQGMGHFARSYRKKFGELPSKTLSRSRLPDRDGE